MQMAATDIPDRYLNAGGDAESAGVGTRPGTIHLAGHMGENDPAELEALLPGAAVYRLIPCERYNNDNATTPSAQYHADIADRIPVPDPSLFGNTISVPEYS